MTNQQAINLLKGLEQSLDDYCELNDEAKAAFRMAVTALEVFGNSEQLPSAQPDIQKMQDLEQAEIQKAYELGKLDAMEEMPHWTPCSERLPEKEGYYLTTTIYKEIYCDYWNGENFDRTEMVIAWMPKPKPYKERMKGR